ncbi:MAG: CoA transferase [Bacillota bacterium]|nr:CoA transferase [Bacillota bacterium]
MKKGILLWGSEWGGKRQRVRTMLPLDGLTVLSTALNVPGPVAAFRLRELGARITKVEPPGGDPLRKVAPSWYQELIRDQEVLTLDLKAPEGQRILHERLSQTDLLLTSQRPSSLARLGLDPDRLFPLYPKLLHVLLVGYGAGREEEPGHDLTYVTQLGMVKPPALPLTLVSDLAGAQRAVQEALALFLCRERRIPQRQAVVSLQEAARLWAAPWRCGLTAPEGLLGGAYPLYRFYRARDGWVAVAALEEKFAWRLCGEMGVDPQRLGQRDTWPEVERALAEGFLRRSVEEWEAWAKAMDVPLTGLGREREVMGEGPSGPPGSLAKGR